MKKKIMKIKEDDDNEDGADNGEVIVEDVYEKENFEEEKDRRNKYLTKEMIRRNKRWSIWRRHKKDIREELNKLSGLTKE
jgi:hypothetical protein